MRMHRRYGEIAWEQPDASSASVGSAGATAAAATLASGRDRAPAASKRTRWGRRWDRSGVNAIATGLTSEPLPSIKLHGVRLHAITEQRCIDHILSQLEAKTGGVVVTP